MSDPSSEIRNVRWGGSNMSSLRVVILIPAELPGRFAPSCGRRTQASYAVRHNVMCGGGVTLSPLRVRCPGRGQLTMHSALVCSVPAFHFLSYVCSDEGGVVAYAARHPPTRLLKRGHPTATPGPRSHGNRPRLVWILTATAEAWDPVLTASVPVRIGAQARVPSSLGPAPLVRLGVGPPVLVSIGRGPQLSGRKSMVRPVARFPRICPFGGLR